MENDLTNNIKPEVTAAYLKSTTKISGWLTFFLVMLALGGIHNGFNPVFKLTQILYDANIVTVMGEIIEGVLLSVLAFYTIFAFIQRRPDAVFSAKTYIVAVAVLNLIMYIMTKSILGIVTSLLGCAAWFAFLCLSDQVETVIPRSYRKVFMHNYIIIALLVLVPLFVWLRIYIDRSKMAAQQTEREENFKNLVLQGNERTDGIMVFTIPDGFECGVEFENFTKAFTLDSDSANAVLFCSSEVDMSESLFNAVWDNAKDLSFEEYLIKVEPDEIKTVNGYKYRYRLTKYDNTHNEFNWKFVVLYDNNKQDACIISYYCYDDDIHLEELLNSIRFL
ncbi:MAG: hypothetical protein J6T60_16620 [Bacteroidales bacterium]|nr:hypothetical protein [Bacteroidales bacterium]